MVGTWANTKITYDYNDCPPKNIRFLEDGEIQIMRPDSNEYYKPDSGHEYTYTVNELSNSIKLLLFMHPYN